MDALLPTLSRRRGLDGLGGLIGKFTGTGLGSKANSWVGTGDNEPLDPDEVERALGVEEVQRIADEAGVSDDEAKSALASMIPGLVDQMSPGGTLPTGGLGESMQRLDFDSIVGP